MGLQSDLQPVLHQHVKLAYILWYFNCFDDLWTFDDFHDLGALLKTPEKLNQLLKDPDH